jgi:hypothetical protein
MLCVPFGRGTLAFVHTLYFAFPFLLEYTLAIIISEMLLRRTRKNKSERKRQGGLSTKISNQPLFDRIIVTLKVSGSVSITDSDTLTDSVVSGNNAFDPLASSGSTQFAAYDQWALLYNRYRVLASRVKAWFGLANTGGGANTGLVRMAICPNSSSGAITTYDEAVGASFAKEDVKFSNAQVAFVSNSMTTRKMTGFGSVEGSDALQALVTTSPDKQYWWHIMTQFRTSATNPGATVEIIVEHDVEFFDRRPVADAATLRERCEELIAARKAYAQRSQGKRGSFDFIERKDAKPETPKEVARAKPVQLKVK